MRRAPKLRIALALADLHGGGAQRVVLRLLAGLDRSRFEPLLMVIENVGAFRALVPPDVPLLDCGRYAAGGRVAWFRRLVGFLRSEPLDLVTSFLWFTNATCLLARGFAGRRVPIVASERVSLEGAREGLVNDLARALAVRLIYPRAERLLTNSVAMADQLARASGVPRGRIAAIPNPVDVTHIRTLAGARPTRARDDLPLVIGMGRLVPQKGFDTAVRALASAATPFCLRILGDGPERARLTALARELDVADRLELTGFTESPFSEIAAADLFVLPSRFEGFPNALAEAMALGLPCIATRCPTGPDEIVEDGESGLLVPVEDAGALAASIDDLLRDPARRDRLGRAAARRAEEFDTARIVRRYEELFEEVAR